MTIKTKIPSHSNCGPVKNPRCLIVMNISTEWWWRTKNKHRSKQTNERTKLQSLNKGSESSSAKHLAIDFNATNHRRKKIVFSVSYKGWNAKGLFVCCCFLSHSRILHFYGDATIIGEGLQMLTYARNLSNKSSIACHTYCDTGHPFIMVISEDP